MADTRSVQPGLWNDRWELPYPFVPRQRIPRYPKRITHKQAAAETVDRCRTLIYRIGEISHTTAHLYGYEALEMLEDHERERAKTEGADTNPTTRSS